MRKTIHIPDNKIDVIKHLKNQINMSGYIVRLIEKDMQSEIITKDMIIDLIKQHGGNNKNKTDLFKSINALLD